MNCATRYIGLAGLLLSVLLAGCRGTFSNPRTVQTTSTAAAAPADPSTGSDTENKTPLRLVVITSESFAKDGVVKVRLENTGKENITILNEFKPLPVFFAFNLIKTDGTPIDAPGAGKVSFDRLVKYVVLEPGQAVGLSVPLKDVFPDISHGEYRLSVEYHNQYGEACFQGRILSNTISIDISNDGGK